MLDSWQLKDVDPLLTNFSTGFVAKELLGETIAPLTQVSNVNGRYMVYDRSDWLIYPDERAMGTVANEIRAGKWSTDTYQVREHSLQVPVFDEEREQLGAEGSFPVDFTLDEAATELSTRSILLGHEKTVADLVRATANYASASHFVTLAGATQWSDYSGTSDPVANIETAMRQVYTATGRAANTMLIPWIVWSYIRNHPKIVDRIKYTRITEDDAFRQLTGFEGTIHIAESQYNAAQHEDLTEVITEVWGKDVWVGIVDPVPGQRTKTFIKSFYFPYEGTSIRPVDRWREEARKADLIRVSQRYDCKIVSNNAGYIIKAAVA